MSKPSTIPPIREALLAIWPSGKECEHAHARKAFELLDAAESREQELVTALEGMCFQYLSIRGGKLHHDFMTAGEMAFDALDWDDMGHPVEKEALCEVEGCGESWTCGTNGRDGKYHTHCGKHHQEWKAAGGEETPEQGDERWRQTLRSIGVPDEEIERRIAARREGKVPE